MYVRYICIYIFVWEHKVGRVIFPENYRFVFAVEFAVREVNIPTLAFFFTGTSRFFLRDEWIPPNHTYVFVVLVTVFW